MEEERVLLTPEQAIAMLADGEQVHAFVNPTGGMLVGADWSRGEAADYIKAAKEREVAGKAAQSMKHGLAVNGERGLVFFATKPLSKRL